MSEKPEARQDVPGHVSAAFRPENVAVLGGDEELSAMFCCRPAQRVALDGLSVAVLLAIWLAFFVFVFLPRGAVG
jgi:hypothetical protein